MYIKPLIFVATTAIIYAKLLAFFMLGLCESAFGSEPNSLLIYDALAFSFAFYTRLVLLIFKFLI